MGFHNHTEFISVIGSFTYSGVHVALFKAAFVVAIFIAFRVSEGVLVSRGQLEECIKIGRCAI